MDQAASDQFPEQYIVVLKVGGNELDDDTFLYGLAQAVKAEQAAGHLPVIVHGGGKAVTDLGARLGLTSSTSRGCASPITSASIRRNGALRVDEQTAGAGVGATGYPHRRHFRR